MQDWWRDQAPATGVTIRDDMRQDVFRPLPVHRGALDKTLMWCDEAAKAVGTRIDVELTVQDGTMHVWLGLDKVDVRRPATISPACCPAPVRSPTAWSVTTMYCCACTATLGRLSSILWPQRACMPLFPCRLIGGGSPGTGTGQDVEPCS
ncbi:hypothetical protein ABZ379_35130 [Streptomyces canus]|uniref:hypothetical protein n=1 Tax=Streptomyces canus TaxID=58343 RepID=UPI0033FB749E